MRMKARYISAGIIYLVGFAAALAYLACFLYQSDYFVGSIGVVLLLFFWGIMFLPPLIFWILHRKDDKPAGLRVVLAVAASITVSAFVLLLTGGISSSLWYFVPGMIKAAVGLLTSLVLADDTFRRQPNLETRGLLTGLYVAIYSFPFFVALDEIFLGYYRFTWTSVLSMLLGAMILFASFVLLPRKNKEQGEWLQGRKEDQIKFYRECCSRGIISRSELKHIEKKF